MTTKELVAQWRRAAAELRAVPHSSTELVAASIEDRANELEACNMTHQQADLPRQETFTIYQVLHSLKAFLEYGENEYGKSQKGYFSGSGFAARAVRFHYEQLKAKRAEEERPSPFQTTAAVRVTRED